MPKSTITIDVTLDEQKMPEQIRWNASGSSAEDERGAKALFLSFWDGEDRTALRIDLWTKDMMVDEMTDFFYQTLMSMADTYQRATRNTEFSQDIKKFAQGFYKKYQDEQLKEQAGSK
ncbi:MAG TPA: gliding motility protein GldC [Chitinophagaceae bacterium]|nr:gliding motility protein GldC [Chitinophagaceae bacterium]